MTDPVVSACKAGLVACPYCGLVCRRAVSAASPPCPRCGGRLQSRKPDSLTRSCAFLVAAAILYIPANLLPVMETTTLFGVQRDTILSGIIYFWTNGSQGLAVLVFFASIMVPMLKLGILGALAWSVRRRWPYYRHQRSTLFRFIELIGRWSMLDVFVVALMVGLVHFQGYAVIEAGPGAAAFGSVVVLTILATRSFDPRLIWDRAEEDHD